MFARVENIVAARNVFNCVQDCLYSVDHFVLGLAKESVLLHCLYTDIQHPLTLVVFFGFALLSWIPGGRLLHSVSWKVTFHFLLERIPL